MQRGIPRTTLPENKVSAFFIFFFCRGVFPARPLPENTVSAYLSTCEYSRVLKRHSRRRRISAHTNIAGP